MSQFLEYEEAPDTTASIRFPFGSMKGQTFRELPDWFLSKMMDEDDPNLKRFPWVPNLIRREWDRRKPKVVK